MRVLQCTLLLLICCTQVAQAKPHVFIIPSLVISNLQVAYNKTADPAKNCDNDKLTNGTMWLPDLSLANIVKFATEFSPALPEATCWYHLMRLGYEGTPGTDGRFVDNTGATVTPVAGNLYDLSGYKNLSKVIQSVVGLTDKDITPLPYDWRLDLSSMASRGLLEAMATAISAKAQEINDMVILVGHSMGCLVTLKLLQEYESVRSVTKAFFSFAGPYGGALSTIPLLTSGTILPFVADSLAGGLAIPTVPGFTLPTVEQLMYNAAQGLAVFGLLAPTRAAFPSNPVVATAGTKTYKLSQLTDLYTDIGQDKLVAAFQYISTLQTMVDSVADKGIDGVDIYCIYGSNVATARSFKYNTTFTAGKQADQPLTRTGKGDKVVPIESLRQCNRLTTPDKVIRLTGSTVNHFSVITDKAAMARFRTALKAVMKK